jgi:hypothetical protein
MGWCSRAQARPYAGRSRSDRLRWNALSDDGIGCRRAVSTAHWTRHGRRHPTTDRLDIERITLPASALDFDCYHKLWCSGLLWRVLPPNS